MAFTVSSLADYTNQEQKNLLVALQFEGETAALANVQPGIKSAEALQILTNSAVPQDGEACGFNASGSSVFTQRVITTKAVKWQASFCLRALQAKWTQKLLKGGQKVDESDLPAIIVDDLVNQAKAQLEKIDWQGDTTSVDEYLNKYDGLIKLIKAATGTNVVSASTWNATNARAIVKAIISKIPAALKGNPDVKIFMGYDAAETYRQALMDANLYHVATGTGNQKGLMAEGSVHEIIPVHGLDGLTGNTGDNPFIFAFNPDSTLYMGVDMKNEEEKVELWYSKDDDDVKLDIRCRRGWQFPFPGEIVEYSNS